MKGTVMGSCEDSDTRDVGAGSAVEAGKGERSELRRMDRKETRRSRRFGNSLKDEMDGSVVEKSNWSRQKTWRKGALEGQGGGTGGGLGWSGCEGKEQKCALQIVSG